MTYQKIPKHLNHVRTPTMGLICNHRTIITIRREQMQLLSREAELELLEKVGCYLEKRWQLELENKDDWDLIPRQDLLEKLDITGTTLKNWEKEGLKSYQSPFENSKKVYYRKSDIYNFLSVD
ncbi:hypothetical protein K3N62_07520 [Streptococcus dysgalactiae subsp. dysgalactiae]|nr:hypothetical protein [Streptococcus dysgalactiae subsp. dysgalactiae]